MRYELFYLIGSSKEAELEKIKGEVNNIITSEGGVFEEKQTEERRKLAYKINHETHGTYIAQRFELENPEKIQAISRKLNLYPEILRAMTSKTSELPELQTKEERIKASEKRSEKTEKKEEETKPETSKEEKKSGGEDIDKKLEEILNI